MQERAFYEDYELRVTASEIRCKHLTIRTDAITSVSIASARPAKWLPLVLLLPLIPVGFILFMVSQLFGRTTPSIFVPVLVGFLPMACLFIVASFIRISRIFLQTSGGPVVLALKIQLSDPAGTLARFQTIKDSIEQAMRASRPS